MDLAYWIQQNKGPALDTLKELIRIEREAGDPVQTEEGEWYPLGKGVQDAFAYLLSRGSEYGFSVENEGGYGGHIEWQAPENGDPVLLGVPDQPDMAAAVFAMESLKEAGFVPGRGIRLIPGPDRETGEAGMGRLIFELVRKLSRGPAKGLALSRLSGRAVKGTLPEKARAVVKGETAAYETIRQKAEEFGRETGHRIRCRGVGKALELLCLEEAGQDTVPEEKGSALSAMFDFLGRLNFANEDINEVIDFYNKHIGYVTDGSSIGCCFGEEGAGKLVWNCASVGFDGNSLSLKISVGYPDVITRQQVYEGMQPFLDRYGMGIVKLHELPPHSYLEGSPLGEFSAEDPEEELGLGRLCQRIEDYAAAMVALSDPGDSPEEPAGGEDQSR